MASSFLAGLICVFLVAPITVYGATFNVNWALGTDYSSWATKDVKVGDTIVFTYDGSSHSVDEVSKSAYSSCSSSNAISTDNSGTTSIPLKTAGPMYFICGTPGHCPPMQLQLNVKAATSTTTPSTTTPSTTTPSTTTPSTTTPSTTTPSTTTTPTSSTKNGGSAHGLSWLTFGVSLVFGLATMS